MASLGQHDACYEAGGMGVPISPPANPSTRQDWLSGVAITLGGDRAIFAPAYIQHHASIWWAAAAVHSDVLLSPVSSWRFAL